MSWWPSLRRWALPPAPSAAVREAVRRVQELDPLLSGLAGLEKRLQGPLEHALGYCEGLVAGVPGPVRIGHGAFAADPLVHALFATASDVDRMFAACAELPDLLSQPDAFGSGAAYGLLAARRQEKQQFGMGLVGNMVQRDVAQTVLFFSDQTISGPSLTLEAAVTALQQRVFLSLLQCFQSHVEALRAERQETAQALSRARSGWLDTVVAGDQLRTVGALEGQLRAHSAALTGDSLLASLVELLQAPEQALRLEPFQATVDRMGVVQAPHGLADDPALPAEKGTVLSFPELTARDRRCYMVMLVEFDRDEAREALEKAEVARQRYIII